MRLTTDPGDPDWYRDKGAAFRVTLNGQVVKDAIEADDVAGYVVVNKRDAQGCFFLDFEGGIQTERREGVVTLTEIR